MVLLSYTVFTFTLCLPLSFSLLCAQLLHNSLSLMLSFSLSLVLAFCLTFLLMFSLVRGVLPRVLFSPISHCLVWFHSLQFCNFLVLVDFVWVDFCSLVLLSLSTRGMFSYLCMFEMLFGCLYHRFRVSKFLDEKTSNGHNF